MPARPRPLQRYQDKRNFDRTPEPSGVVAPPSDAPLFVVQRHRARRLHYDFRLEIDGVLVSWAVPKGLTLDPGQRHLAVHVEDHPLDYADFEGVIPRGEYGGGDVIVWDRGTWELHGATDASAAIDAGELHVDLRGEKLRGRFVLVRSRRGSGDRDEWLVFHKRDADAVEGWDPEEHPQSVLTGRDNDEVATERTRVWTRAGEAGTVDAVTQRHAGATDDELAAFDALGDHGTWNVGGREVRLTHLEEVLFPARGRARPVTKRELVRYHAEIAPWMLPYLEDRPLDLHRSPDGTDRKGVWQKQAPAHAPDWIERWTNADADAGERRHHLVVADVAGLVWLANHAAVELHPWTSRRPDVEKPTYALVDLDPGEDTTWDELLTLARLHRTALEHLGVRGYPKTNGRRGIQVWIPMEAGPSFDETRAWVRQVSEAVAGVVRDVASAEWRKDRRGGKARLDHTQHATDGTPVAPFSARAGAGAPVSMPITWDELDDRALRPDRWTVRDALARVRAGGDPMAPMLTDRQHLVPLR